MGLAIFAVYRCISGWYAAAIVAGNFHDTIGAGGGRVRDSVCEGRKKEKEVFRWFHRDGCRRRSRLRRLDLRPATVLEDAYRITKAG